MARTDYGALRGKVRSSHQKRDQSPPPQALWVASLGNAQDPRLYLTTRGEE